MSAHSHERIDTIVFSFLEDFKPLFSQAEYESFVIFVLGLLSDTRNKTVSGLARLDGLKDHTVLSKFLQSRNAGKLSLALRKVFFEKVDCSQPLFFYLDDTLVEKAGKKVRAEFNFSTSQGKSVLSNCFVMGLAKNGSLTLPFDFAKYIRNAKTFKTKTEFAPA